LDLGLVEEVNLGTTQGNLGMNGHTSDHSTGGCTVIAYLICSAFLVGIATRSNVELIIDRICQEPLKHIRDEKYPDKGFVHVTAEDAVDKLITMGVFEIPNVSALLIYYILLATSSAYFFRFREHAVGFHVTHSLGIFYKMRKFFGSLFPNS